MARAGADGVNIHTFPGARYALFTFQHGPSGWTGTVHAEYYGLLMFARAAPPGSRLLWVRTAGSAAVGCGRRGRPTARIRLVLINADLTHRHMIAIRQPSHATAASVDRLQAPSATATAGVTSAGQSIAERTRTGTLRGAVRYADGVRRPLRAGAPARQRGNGHDQSPSLRHRCELPTRQQTQGS